MARSDIKMQKPAVVTKPNRAYTPLNASYVERKEWYLTPRWKQFRSEYLAVHRWCVRCAEKGQQVRAVVVDHIDGHDPQTWKETFWEGGKGGFQALCMSCHSRKTVLEDQKKKPKRLSASARRQLLRKCPVPPVA